VNLHGNDKIIGEFSVVCNSILGDNFKNSLIIYSPIVLQNSTKEIILVKILHANREIIIELKENDWKPVPFDCIDYNHQISIDDGRTWTDKFPLYKLYHRPNNFYHQFD